MATLQGRILLGWMPKDVGVQFLLNDCHFDPPISQDAATLLWEQYRARVEALPDRNFVIPPSMGLSIPEAHHTKIFRRFLDSLGAHDVEGVRKVDLRQLTVIQYYVVTERSQGYRHTVQGNDWLTECLPTTPRNSGDFQMTYMQQGMNTNVQVDLPHAECFFVPDQTGKFGVSEGMRHVTAMIGTDRMYLTAGYHRTFAKVLTAPTATVPSAVIAVARNTIVSPPNDSALPGVSTGAAGIDPLCPLGAKAAKFEDFFTDGLFMNVDLRKKRYQIHVTANWVALDDPN